MDVTIPADASAADWVIAGVRGDRDIGSLVPHGFEAYGRMLHAAERKEDGDGDPVRWSEIAAATGGTIHPGVQLEGLVGAPYYEAACERRDLFGDPPEQGSLSAFDARHLIPALRPWTTTPDECWQAIWDGTGVVSELARSAPTFDLPGWRYHLVRAPIEFADGRWTSEPHSFPRTPNLWWPADRAWCVVTQYTLGSTYIGGSAALIASLVANAQLEVLAVSISDEVWGDSVNAIPEPPPQAPAPSEAGWEYGRYVPAPDPGDEASPADVADET